MDKERLKELIKSEYSDEVLQCLWELYDLKVIAEHNKNYKEYQEYIGWRNDRDLQKAAQICLLNYGKSAEVQEDDYIPDSLMQKIIDGESMYYGGTEE